MSYDVSSSRLPLMRSRGVEDRLVTNVQRLHGTSAGCDRHTETRTPTEIKSVRLRTLNQFKLNLDSKQRKVSRQCEVLDKLGGSDRSLFLVKHVGSGCQTATLSNRKIQTRIRNENRKSCQLCIWDRRPMRSFTEIDNTKYRYNVCSRLEASVSTRGALPPAASKGRHAKGSLDQRSSRRARYPL